MYVAFDEWTQGRSIASLGTNAGADELPFQSWRSFKEAYAPELVERAVRESAIPVRRALDPFGGSGTTAFACQFLGVLPTTVEVNPFLADLIEAKLSQYDADALARDLGLIALRAANEEGALNRLAVLPPTFVEPGIKDRWIFDCGIATRIAAFLEAIESLPNDRHRRLFKVLLGGILIDVSNVVVSGKGRRYRRGWQDRTRAPGSVDEAFFTSARNAIGDIHRYANRRELGYELIRGDARCVIDKGRWDLALFSPPYPNSFDYTDVYNVELWMLGYLNSSTANRLLREATLSSHVQISRSFAPPPPGSDQLDEVMANLIEARSKLWDARIPDMVGAYFADLMAIIRQIGRGLTRGGSLWLVVGDSQYAGIPIAAAEIIGALAERDKWVLRGYEPFRSMRLSAQQGGRPELAETLIMLERAV
ncbi:hypothetical protein [Mesorhizobium sp. M7A.F.Ca.US.008.03.1.1]|uniref:hypothetical protein n=1 Tax=Mesorhizobium sp. M7A.F.Ca.US.008.03.1.1 TaxID=2496742 RepID=UPI000FC9DA21|nr:hypothetical protein [Mesorhizobium sp. M7A.F.Ca.US.008.03.1.1]RUW62737.1 hypothetical protein EOA16_06580 [Mesorhizobium sp. M7A.F.Ca.US.008.03.1.1]